MSININWTAAMIADVVRRKDGGESFSSIARAYGCSRSSVAGIHRRARIRRGEIAYTPHRKAAGSAPRASERLPAPIPAPVIEKPSTERACPIHEVSGCRWEITGADEPRDFLFCNAPQCDGSAYCEFHRRESVAEYSTKLIRQTIKGAMRAYKPKRKAA